MGMVLSLTLVMMLLITNLPFMTDVLRQMMVSPLCALSRYYMRERSRSESEMYTLVMQLRYFVITLHTMPMATP